MTVNHMRLNVTAARRPRHLFAIVACTALVALAVGACSSSASGTGAGNGTGTIEQPAPPKGGAPVPAGSPAALLDVAGGSGSRTTADGNPPAAFTDIQSGPLIVRTGTLALEVKDLDTALLSARARVVGLGGYPSDSERSNADDKAMAVITYRIPAARWDDALDGLRGLATKVVMEQTRSAEVTGQVLDLGARIDNLVSTEHALQAIMAQATKISDILDVQNQLTAVQGQIEQLSTEKAHLSDQAAMGTLAVTYTVPVVAVTHVSSGWSLSEELDRALAQLVQVGQGLAVVAVWVAVVVLPLLMGALILFGLAIFVTRRLGLGRRPAAAGPVPSVPGTGA
jgi:hypothetical protein